MKKVFLMRSLKFVMSLAVVTFFYSCDDDSNGGGDPDDPIASFNFEISDTDFFEVSFTNVSQNAESYEWDFDDGNTSTEFEPTHTYTGTGDFDVTLTATNSAGETDTQTKTITITDPNEELRKLTGESSKTWRLLRDVSAGDFPLAVGPQSRVEIWFALGGPNGGNVGDRPCILDDNYIFSIDGTFEYQDNGDVWADAGTWNESTGAPACVDSSVPANMINVDGADISAWGSGTHAFDFDAANGTLTVNGLGAFIGLPKAGTNAEFTVPQTSVTYEVIKLVDATVDTLIVETRIDANDGYWRMVLVHYDNPGDEPPIPGPPPTPGFTADVNGLVVSFTNTSLMADSFLWDFGDGTTATEANPTHTYADCGSYTVTLTATNANGSADASESISVGADPSSATAADLHGGSSRTWKVAPEANSVRVGSFRGGGDFFTFPEAFLTERPCFYDDEFIIKSDNTFDFDSKGQIFNEAAVFGGADGCIDDAAIAVPFDVYGSNTGYGITIDEGAQTITVTGVGAYLGFVKGFNGGEIANTFTAGDLPTSVTYEIIEFIDCGTSQTLDIAVDISGTGTAWWSMKLIAE